MRTGEQTGANAVLSVYGKNLHSVSRQVYGKILQ
jgi:hypothetical protein